MTDNIDNAFTAATDTAEPVEASVVEAVKKVGSRRVKAERKPRAAKAAAVKTKTRKTAPRAAKAAAVPTKTRKTAPRAAKVAAGQTKTRNTAPRAAKAAPELKDTSMNFDPMNWTNLQSLNTLPGADRFQTLFADAGSRGQEAIEKSRRAAEDMAELTRANVDAIVEAGKIAATGAKSVGEDALQRARQGLEQNVTEFKTLAQATSPTEFFQLQSEIAKHNFDRMVASLSQLTEASVKLAGEAVQPLSNRAALNAEKLNELTA